MPVLSKFKKQEGDVFNKHMSVKAIKFAYKLYGSTGKERRRFVCLNKKNINADSNKDILTSVCPTDVTTNFVSTFCAH